MHVCFYSRALYEECLAATVGGAAATAYAGAAVAAAAAAANLIFVSDRPCTIVNI